MASFFGGGFPGGFGGFPGGFGGGDDSKYYFSKRKFVKSIHIRKYLCIENNHIIL